MTVHAILQVEILQNYIHFLRWNLRTSLRVKRVFFYTWAFRYVYSLAAPAPSHRVRVWYT